MTRTRTKIVGIAGACILLAGGLFYGLRKTGVDEVRPSQAGIASGQPIGILSDGQNGAASSNSAEEQAALSMMDKAAENEYLILYVNNATAEVAVKDKRSDYIWFSNPPEREKDPIASPLYKSELSSQVTLSYYNDKGQLSSYNSYDDSVKLKQFEISQKDGEVEVRYSMGKAAVALDGIPKIISKDRMEQKILNRLQDEDVKKSLLYKFKYDETKQVYAVRELKEFVAQELLGILQQAGYTKEDAAQDNAANGIAAAAEDNGDNINFTVPVVYSLQNDQFVVTIPVDEVQYPKAYPIAALSVLKYFGAADETKEGYLFVPDGSGALIRLNNGKLGAEPYRMPLYGEDSTVVVKEKIQSNEASRLPVFGMKQNDHAFVGIIEKGDALATVNADVSGRYHQYNSVASEYHLVNMDYYTLNSGERTSSVPMFQSETYKGDIRIRYAFTAGSSADYVGMAKVYRQYLVQSNGLTRLPAQKASPFIMELHGAFQRDKSFLGIHYNAIEPLTTYDEAKKLLGTLEDRGVTAIALRYSEWFNGGIRFASARKKTSPIGALGGKSGLQDLAEYAQSRQIGLYPDISFLKADKKAGAAEFLNHSKAKIYEFDPVMNTQDLSRFSHYVVSATQVPGIVSSFVQRYSKLVSGGVSLNDLGNQVDSDYSPDHPIDRQSALGVIEGELAKLNGAIGSVMVSGGNAYSIPYADIVVNAPTRSSGMNLTDEDVPFYQIVLHGYVQMAGLPFNTAKGQNPRLSLLKALETGSNIYYEWFYREPSVVKDTDRNGLYSANYEGWLDEAVQIYREADGFLSKVADQAIIGHSKLAEGVYRTVYENGQSVTVNYNEEAVSVDGMELAPEGYVVQAAGASAGGAK